MKGTQIKEERTVTEHSLTYEFKINTKDDSCNPKHVPLTGVCTHTLKCLLNLVVLTKET